MTTVTEFKIGDVVKIDPLWVVLLRSSIQDFVGADEVTAIVAGIDKEAEEIYITNICANGEPYLGEYSCINSSGEILKNTQIMLKEALKKFN